MLDECDLPSKKSSLQKIFGSNLTLRNKKPSESPVKQYAALRAARANFSENDLNFILAAGLGFEPRYTAPEAVVLPLDDPAITYKYLQNATVRGVAIV